MPPLRHHHRRRLQLRGRRRRGGGRDGPARDRLPRGLRPRRDGARSGSPSCATRVEPRALRPGPPRRLAARALHLHARALRGLRRSSGFRSPPTSPRASPSARSCSTARATGRPSPHARPTARADRDPDARRCRAARAGLMAAHCVDVEEDEIALLAEHGGRGCALPALERDPRLRRRPARGARSRRGSRSGSRPTAPPRRRRSTCSTSCAPPIVAARARERRPDALTAARRARARDARRRPGARPRRRGRLARPGQVGRSRRSSRSTDSPLAPVEDPVVAAVLGGSPERVAATLVAGEDRYRRGTSAWPDSRRAARRARSRMLR